MQEIVPYQSGEAALEALDNGGRFYNIFTAASDGEITAAELAKVAGSFMDFQRMFLYLDLATEHLSEPDRATVVAALSADLRQSYDLERPRHFTVSEACDHGVPAQSAIVAGTPRHVDSRTRFSYFMMIPVQTGNVSSMMMVPIMDQYDVYEVRDEAQGTDYLVAHGRGVDRLPEVRMQLAGVIKELQQNDESTGDHRHFLDLIYYTRS